MKSLDLNIGTWIATLLQFVAWVGLVWILIVSFQYKKEISISGVEVHIHNPENRVHLIEVGKLTQFVLEALEDSIQHYKLADLPLQLLFRKINEHPYIESAKVFINKDGLLKIECQPRYPVARIVPARGESYYIDLEGEIMPLPQEYRPKLPIVRGRVPQANTADHAELDELARLGELFYLISRSPFMEVFVDQVIVTALKEYILIPIMGTEKIELGEWERMQEKLWDLEDFYTEVIAQIGWGKYEKISLKFDGQIVATRKTTATP